MATPLEALRRLNATADSGELGRLCQGYDAELLVAFGSAVREENTPRDLDLAVLFRPQSGRRPDVLGFLDRLVQLTDSSELDLMDLGRAGPVARERALVGGYPLVQLTSGVYARQQIRAMMERMDTAWLRRLDLELMAR